MENCNIWAERGKRRDLAASQSPLIKSHLLRSWKALSAPGGQTQSPQRARLWRHWPPLPSAACQCWLLGVHRGYYARRGGTGWGLRLLLFGLEQNKAGQAAR